MVFKTRSDSGGSIIIIQIPKKMDFNVSDDLKVILRDLSDQGIYKWVMDLKKTEYLDSSGLGAFISHIAVCRSHQGDIYLVAPTEYIRSLLSITHLDKVLKSFDSVKAAVEKFKKQQE